MFDSETRWFIRCDTCPDDVPKASRSAKAHDKVYAKLRARRDGWSISDELHRCPTCVREGRTAAAPGEMPRCQHVSASPWGTTQCALPADHEERHAYSPSEATS